MAGRQSMGGQYFMPGVERTTDDRSEMESSLASVTPSLKKILQMNAQTSEEKFKVLDARDKLLKMIQDKNSSLKRSALVATCTDMCPEKERLLREYQGRGSMFEMTNFSKNSNFNHSLAVKEYARSSADQEEPLPQDLRPVSVLTLTMSHLLHNVVDYSELSDDNLEEWYMFVWDRLRALRKDLTQQGVCSMESVVLVEQCARFHIHCAERLVDQDTSIYDDKINTENLTKCLQTLKYLYKDLAKEDVKCPNEPEFICYSLLLNLNNSSVFTELSGMSSSLLSSEPVKFALDVMTTWETKNYIRFFNLVKKTTYLNCCLLRRYFGEMRLYAVKTMIRLYCTKSYSPQIFLSRFVENLNFEGEEECINFLTYCNFNFLKIGGKTAVNFDRLLFQNPKTAMTFGRASIFIGEKKQRPLSVIMAGGTLPPRLFENYVPHTSFTPNGDLNPDTLPQELSEFLSASVPSKIDAVKPEAFQEREQSQSMRDSKLQKKEGETTTWSSTTPIFSFKDPKAPPPANIFGANPPSFGSVSFSSNIFGNNFSNTGNVFNSAQGDDSIKPNIFGNNSSLFAGTKTSFDSTPKLFSSPSFPSAEEQKPPMGTAAPAIGSFLFQRDPRLAKHALSKSNVEEAKGKEEAERKERMEEERRRREKEEEEKRKREEEAARLLLEKKRLEEENARKEREERERRRREEEERLRKEELARLEMEERNRREEEARQRELREARARRLEEMEREAENQRRVQLEYKRKVDSKMSELKEKVRKWKTKIVFDKWRMKTWASIEERKMKEYFKEVKLKYPPVCTEEELNGNPYGLLIPNILTFEKFREWKRKPREEPPKKLLIVNDELPLLRVGNILGKPLQDLAKRLESKLDPFPWKLVISVPDRVEAPNEWKSIETFVEMHFVENFSWQFGVEKGPLYNRGGSRGNFRFRISVRRVRGSRLHEGSEPNPSATTGSNALIFFVSEQGNEVTCERLKEVLKSRAPLPKIPLIVIILNGQPNLDHFKKLLNLEALQQSHISKYFVLHLHDGKHELIKQLTKCLCLAAVNSAPPSPLRVDRFSNFFLGSWIESLWRRVEISLSNFKISLKEPKVLIEFYNSCIEELQDIFLDKSNSQQTSLAEEFSECPVIVPSHTSAYENKLKSLLNRLKFPHWPAETPKSCHQLNYRIHQYCKKITGQDKAKLKNLKWLLYRIIRQSLSRKGLDIYCDEDVYEILVNFPWIQVFQEVSRVVTRQLCEEVAGEEETIVVYDLVRVEKFCFESSFIGKFLKKSRGRPPEKWWQRVDEAEGEADELSPCLEKDSVLYAYSAAIERENNKRKREECVEEGLDALFLSPAGKRLVLEEETQKVDFSGIEAKFESLEERLAEMRKRMTENYKVLTDIQSEIQ